MDAIQALHERVSVAKLGLPAPDQAQCRLLIQAALRAADHGALQPWRFLLVQGDGLQRLGDSFVSASLLQDPDLSEAAIERLRGLPTRAPMVMVVVARCQDHPKVPVIEQQLSAGAAAQNILNAAFALGLGAIWRTGELAYNRHLAQALGLAAEESIVGFIYLGTPLAPPASPKKLNPDDFFRFWPAE